MSNETDTPLTDALDAEWAAWDMDSEPAPMQMTEHARQLERQLESETKWAKHYLEKWQEAERQLAEARLDVDYWYKMQRMAHLQLEEARKDTDRLDWLFDNCEVKHYLDAWDDYPTRIAHRDDIDELNEGD